MKKLNYVIEKLEKEKDELLKDSNRLMIQIDTCDQMINGYNKKLNENDEKIKSINDVIEML